jgi:AcrR family transcriptional regulator
MFVVCHDGHMAVSAELRRRQPVQERSRKRVERILASALNLLNAGGADAVTTRAIASAAGIPVATVYQFFPNREAILVELLEAFLARRDVEGLALLAELTPATLDEVFGEICRFHRDGLAEYPHMADLYYTYRANGMVVSSTRRCRARPCSSPSSWAITSSSSRTIPAPTPRASWTRECAP